MPPCGVYQAFASAAVITKIPLSVGGKIGFGGLKRRSQNALSSPENFKCAKYNCWPALLKGF